MNITLMQRLIYDMSIVIKDHGLEKIDTHTALLIEMANVAVANGEVNIPEDNSRMIEAIRQDNFHALAG